MPKQNPEKAVPSYGLSESVEVGQLIRDNNAGKTIDRISLAEWVGYSPQSGNYPKRLAAAKLYGLVEVSGDNISLSELGTRLLYPESESVRVKALEQVARSPQILNKLYDHFNGNELPTSEIAGNILRRTYHIDEKKVSRLWEVFTEDAEYLGVIHSVKGKRYINMTKLVSKDSDIRQTDPSNLGEEPISEIDDTSEQNATLSQSKAEHSDKSEHQTRFVFVSHGKNRKILDQIKTTLELGGFDPRVAIHEETTAVPVPEKVFTAMRECSAGIINLSADELITTADGDESYRINENVLIEIGAAFVLYNKKVVLVADRRVHIPSNLQGLYLCSYEGDSLDWEAGMKLQKALLEFKK